MTSAQNSSFSKEIPNLQIAWDSVSSGALKKCPRYYEYFLVRGYSLPGTNDDLLFGILFHSATELYEHLRASDTDHEEAVNHVVYCLLINTWDFIRKRPWVSVVPTKNRDTLIRTTILYLDKYKDDPMKTVVLASTGKAAVEVSFRLDLSHDVDESFKAPSGESYLLCGHLDRIALWNNQTFVPDKKTTRFALDDDYFKQYAPDNQVSIYALAGQIILSEEIQGVVIDAAQVLANGTRFRRKEIYRSAEQLSEWLNDFRYLLRQNETYARDNYWPMNDKACGFGRMRCAFAPVCSADPIAREEMLESFYVKKVWDPMVPR